MTGLIETPKSYLHSYFLRIFETVESNPKQSDKNRYLKSIESLLCQETTNKINLEEQVNFKYGQVEETRLFPLWLVILFRTERLYKNLLTIEERAKKMGKIIDLILPIISISGTSEYNRSYTAEAARYSYWYTAFRLAPNDPNCGGDRDMIFQYCGSVLFREKKLTTIALQVLNDIHGAESKVNNRSTDSGRTGLHYACAFSNPEIVRWLVEKGIDVNAQDLYGHTPLWHCISGVELGIQHGEPRSAAAEIMEFLLDNGANPLIPNHKGKYFLEHLKKNYRAEDSIIQRIESLPRDSIFAERVHEKKANLVDSISDIQIIEHDPKLLFKYPHEIVESLIVLFQRLAVIEFYPKDIIDILSRRKRIHNKKQSGASPEYISESYDLSTFVVEIINISANKKSPIKFDVVTWAIHIKGSKNTTAGFIFDQ